MITVTKEIARISVMEGMPLSGSSNVFGTRSFYFGDISWEKQSDQLAPYVLSIDCAWRLEKNSRIIVGSGDFYAPAENPSDPSWESGNQTGHLQNQILLEFFGTIYRGMLLASKQKLHVQSIHTDSLGGFRMQLSDGFDLVVFPDSSRGPQWNLLGDDGLFVSA